MHKEVTVPCPKPVQEILDKTIARLPGMLGHMRNNHRERATAKSPVATSDTAPPAAAGDPAKKEEQESDSELEQEVEEIKRLFVLFLACNDLFKRISDAGMAQQDQTQFLPELDALSRELREFIEDTRVPCNMNNSLREHLGVISAFKCDMIVQLHQATYPEPRGMPFLALPRVHYVISQ